MTSTSEGGAHLIPHTMDVTDDHQSGARSRIARCPQMGGLASGGLKARGLPGASQSQAFAVRSMGRSIARDGLGEEVQLYEPLDTKNHRLALLLSMMACALSTVAHAHSPTGIGRGEVAPFDAEIIALLEKYGVPGEAIAVARHGKLVISRGNGVADRDSVVLSFPNAFPHCQSHKAACRDCRTRPGRQGSAFARSTGRSNAAQAISGRHSSCRGTFCKN